MNLIEGVHCCKIFPFGVLRDGNGTGRRDESRLTEWDGKPLYLGRAKVSGSITYIEEKSGGTEIDDEYSHHHSPFVLADLRDRLLLRNPGVQCTNDSSQGVS